MPVIKEVERLQKIEQPPQPAPHKLPFMKIHKFTKEIPQIPLPSFPNVKELFHHQYETKSEAAVESEAPEHKVHQMSW